MIPFNILTGFLGSGKTTLLSRLLRQKELSGCAVLINEFGAVGLDHELVQRVDGDVTLLASGCICCTIRGDLATAIRDLYARREAGTIPAFDRLIVETTGLADPTPILATILQDPVLRHHFRVGNVLTTVDAVNGLRQIDQQPESVKQAAIADRILLTKTDLVSSEQAAAVRDRLRALNPTAELADAHEADVARLLLDDAFDPARRDAEIGRWVSPFLCEAVDDAQSRHGEAVRTLMLRLDMATDWNVFGAWLTLLLAAHGERVLRVKGILDVPGVPTPVAVHGVQHLVHAPMHMAAWPEGERSSRLVVIVRGLDPAAIERSFLAFQAALGSGRLAAA